VGSPLRHLREPTRAGNAWRGLLAERHGRLAVYPIKPDEEIKAIEEAIAYFNSLGLIGDIRSVALANVLERLKQSNSEPKSA